jgi:hypothetical protein
MVEFTYQTGKIICGSHRLGTTSGEFHFLIVHLLSYNKS